MQQSFFNFIISPISLLSGTFFSVDVVESDWQSVFTSNPLYHMVSNLRKSFENNQSYNFDDDILLLILIFIIVYITLYIFKKGYRVIA